MPAFAGMEIPEGLATVPDVLAANIRKYRAMRDWRQLDLIGRMDGLGLTWNRQIVSAVESALRNVTTTELACLAIALGVSLEQLLDPRPAGVKMALRGTWEWLSLDDDEFGALICSHARVGAS